MELRQPEPAAGDDGGEPDLRARPGADDDETTEPPPPAIKPPLDDVPPESVEPGGRRYPSTLGGAFYLVVLGASAVGLGIVAGDDWRLGVKWIGASLVFAAVVRLVLPEPQAGMLAVRRRSIDVFLLAAVGVVLWFLSISIPNQPPL